MITRFANKLTRGRVRLTTHETGVLLEERVRDDDDNLVWVTVGVTSAAQLDDLIRAAQAHETALRDALQNQRQAIANLEAIKTAVEAAI